MVSPSETPTTFASNVSNKRTRPKPNESEGKNAHRGASREDVIRKTWNLQV